MNYKLRDLLSRQKYIGHTHTFSYSAALRESIDVEGEIKRRMADRVAHAIAGDILRGGTWARRAEPEGIVYTVRGLWLDYETAYRLLEEAYSMGRTEPVFIMPNSASDAAIDAARGES